MPQSINLVHHYPHYCGDNDDDDSDSLIMIITIAFVRRDTTELTGLDALHTSVTMKSDTGYNVPGNMSLMILSCNQRPNIFAYLPHYLSDNDFLKISSCVLYL